MLPENKLGCFQCSKIVPRVKDNIKIPYFLLKCNPIAKEPFGVNKQGSFSTKVKESFENNRTASCAAATEAPYLIKSNIHQWNKNLFAQLKCLYFQPDTWHGLWYLEKNAHKTTAMGSKKKNGS